jgi:hypothetical protein
MGDINISGTIGVSFLKKDNKKIIIFYDDHSNMKYCDSSYFINNFFDEITTDLNKTVILLEEPLLDEKDSKNILFLWNNIPHIIKAKEFYKKIINKCTNKKICRVFPIDIRLCLIDISIEEYFTKNDNIYLNVKTIRNDNIKINKSKILKKYNNKYKQKFTDDKLNDYFKYFIFLFDCDYVDEKKFTKNSKIYFIKEVFSMFKDNNYYIETKNKFLIFFNKFIKPNINEKIIDFVKKYEHQSFKYIKGFPYINDDEDNFMSQFNRIHNNIMEFYSVVIIVYSNYNNVTLYSGYYHSNNISFLLEKNFGFVNEKNIGYVDNINEFDQNLIKNCVNINKNMILDYLK